MGAIFDWASRVIRHRIGFAFLRTVIGPENSHQSLNRSDAKRIRFKTWSPAFSRASRCLVVFTLNFYWPLRGIFLSSDWRLRLRYHTLPNMLRISRNFPKNVAESNSDWIKGVSFLRNCGVAWLGEYNRVILNRDDGGLLPDAYLHLDRKKGS